MIKILIGGSPCTHWSIAQKNNRETEPNSGSGWELFKNFLIAKDKYKPDYFLYENNKSASQGIKDEIAKQLGAGTDKNVRFTYINSALVSAQNRQRFYVTNFGDIEQPEDRGILLKDVLESGVSDREKARCVTASVGRTTHREYFKKSQNTISIEPVGIGYRGRMDGGKWVKQYESNGTEKANALTTAQTDSMVAEPVNITADGKARTVRATCYKDGIRNMVGNDVDRKTCVAEPIAVDLQVVGRKRNQDGEFERAWEARADGKSSCITTVESRRMVAEPIRVGDLPNDKGDISGSQATRIYGINGKTVNLVANGGGQGAKTGLYAIPVSEPVSFTMSGTFGDRRASVSNKAYCLAANPSSDMSARCIEAITGYATPCEWDEDGTPTKAVSCADGKTYTVYEVENGQITIKEKQYPIKLPDGFYIIRKLTVKECMRLQTVPEWYKFPVSDSQAYKMLGNGWTVEVIKHLLSHIPNIENEEIEVLSMYDGMSCGQIALKELGCNIVKYYATEIDKYAIQTTQENFPNTIQLGDAFQVREEEWWFDKCQQKTI